MTRESICAAISTNVAPSAVCRCEGPRLRSTRRHRPPPARSAVVVAGGVARPSGTPESEDIAVARFYTPTPPFSAGQEGTPPYSGDAGAAGALLGTPAGVSIFRSTYASLRLSNELSVLVSLRLPL